MLNHKGSDSEETVLSRRDFPTFSHFCFLSSPIPAASWTYGLVEGLVKGVVLFERGHSAGVTCIIIIIIKRNDYDPYCCTFKGGCAMIWSCLVTSACFQASINSSTIHIRSYDIIITSYCNVNMYHESSITWSYLYYPD